MRRRLLALVLVLLGCGQDATTIPPPPGDASAFDEPPHPGAEVVATVNGTRIYVEDVARQAAAASMTPRAALDELIRIELLFQEALRRGLLEDPAVKEAYRSAQVREIIARDFEARLATPAQVPDHYVAQAWQNNVVHTFFNHPRYHLVAFVRVQVPRRAPADVEAEARRDAFALRERLVAAKPADRDAFLAEAIAGANELGAQFSISGTTNQSVARVASHVKEFADAAFSLEKPGDISQPARTDWGWDILYLVDILPERALTREQAAPELKAKIFDGVRQKEFALFAEEVMKQAQVERNDALIEKVVVESPLAGGP